METLALSKSLRKRILLESTLLLVAACNQTQKQTSLSFDSEKVPSINQSAPLPEKNSSIFESLFSKEPPKSKLRKQSSIKLILFLKFLQMHKDTGQAPVEVSQVREQRFDLKTMYF